MIKVSHIITGLSADGAERMLFNLVTRMDRARFANSVISLTGMGDLGSPLRDQHIPVHALGLRKSVSSVRELWRLRQVLRSEQPHVVQTWMYHADLVGGLAAREAGVGRVLWGIHHADVNRGSAKWLTRATAHTCAMLSPYVPQKVIFCSDASRAAHTRIGYARAKAEFIPNGFDTDHFRPDPALGKVTRSELRIRPDALLVGLLGRFHPHKDHSNFVSAAALISRVHPEVEFVLCGRDVTGENNQLWGQIRAAGLERRVHTLGVREDVHRILAAVDIVVSSSRTEAFPLAVGEAMSAGVPCVVTDVGDSRSLVGDTGIVVPPQDATALANGINLLLEYGQAQRVALGCAARTRILSSFSLTATVKRYEELYSQFAMTPHPDQSRHTATSFLETSQT